MGTFIPTTFVPLTPQLRRRIEETIEQLLAILDAFEGDPDFEQNVDDFGQANAGDEGELEDDFEPELGWTAEVNQACISGDWQN